METGIHRKKLINQIFEPPGPRQLKSDSAQIIRHILFTNPKVGISKFPELFASMFVLITGRAPEEREITSPSTIRSHVERLNNFDLYDIGQMFVELTKDLSHCGNKNMFSSITDDTKHGAQNGRKFHVNNTPVSDFAIVDPVTSRCTATARTGSIALVRGTYNNI